MIPTPEEAWELLCEYNEGEFHRKHGRIVGDVLRWYVVKLGYENEADFWQAVGILHDLDFEQWPQQHCLKEQELLQQKELPQDSRAAQILPLARERAAFFAEMCGGIQFVYDRWLGTFFLTDWAKAPADRRTVIHLSAGEQPPILSPEALDALRTAVQHATPDAPQGALDLPFPYRGTETPCTLHFRVLWPQGSRQYSTVIGLVRPAEA